MQATGIVEELASLFQQRGGSEYGGESVTQQEHALQCAELAENNFATPALVIAALLHDVGHMLHDLPDDAPDQGVDDFHEKSGNNYLRKHFPESVSEPVRQHVAAKRYLCTVDENYESCLSEPSIVSLNLQGGRMSDDELAEFRKSLYWEDALKLRKWDDLAKIEGKKTPAVEYYLGFIARIED